MSKTELNERIKNFLNTALKKISGKKFDSAIDELQRALVLDKDNPEIIFNLGICYCKKGLFKTAISYFNKIPDLPMKFVDIISVYQLLSYCHIMINDYQSAKASIDKGLKISKNNTNLLNMLGYIFEKEKNTNKALEIYKTIINIDKNNTNAFNSIAYLMAESEIKLDEALGYARKALKNNPENPAYLDTMGYIQMKKGQRDIAKNFLKKALEKNPESKEIKAHINELLKIE